MAVQMLAERMPGLSRAGEVERRNATTIRGPIRLPVRAGDAQSGGDCGQLTAATTVVLLGRGRRQPPIS